MKLNELITMDDLEGALKESSERPVLLFKHSNACPISSRALSELQAYLQDGDPHAHYYFITVQTSRPVSNEIESRLSVQHETPQAILVKDGRLVWDASHFSITASALRHAVQEVS